MPKRSGPKTPWFALAVIAGIAACALAAWGWAVHNHATFRHPAGAEDSALMFHGPFGDAFGPLAALFSAITMGLAYWSLHEQRVELHGQHAELQRHFEALDGQRKALEQHTELLTASRDVVAAQNSIAALRMQMDLITKQIDVDLALRSLHTNTPVGVLMHAQGVDQAESLSIEAARAANQAAEIAGVRQLERRTAPIRR